MLTPKFRNCSVVCRVLNPVFCLYAPAIHNSVRRNIQRTAVDNKQYVTERATIQFKDLCVEILIPSSFPLVSRQFWLFGRTRLLGSTAVTHGTRSGNPGYPATYFTIDRNRSYACRGMREWNG